MSTWQWLKQQDELYERRYKKSMLKSSELYLTSKVAWNLEGQMSKTEIFLPI